MNALRKKHNGYAIALAWPQTYCKQPGAWYDRLMTRLNINRHHYYRAGHAALVLVGGDIPTAHYFDFGRYHSPYQHGRARSAETDHDLTIHTVPVLSQDGKQIENLDALLEELQQNEGCHGEGTLYAGCVPVHFEGTMARARALQAAGPLPYGPFVAGGTNCSRFVRAVVLAGSPPLWSRLKLKILMPVTPTTISNIKALPVHRAIPHRRNGARFTPVPGIVVNALKTTLPPPPKHHNVPHEAQWLSGEGAGSWFMVERNNDVWRMIRYAPNGEIECDGIFKPSDSSEILPEHQRFTVTYPSNCLTLHLNTGNKLWVLNRALPTE